MEEIKSKNVQNYVMNDMVFKKAQHEFTIKGIKIMAASKKDAIKKFNHIKK